MLPTPKARCRVTILGTLTLQKQGLTLPQLYRVVAEDLPGICSRQDFADVIAELESESLIDSELGFRRGTRKVYFVPARAGGRIRVVPAALAPLPAMDKRTWFSDLEAPAQPSPPSPMAATWADALSPVEAA